MEHDDSMTSCHQCQVNALKIMARHIYRNYDVKKQIIISTGDMKAFREEVLHKWNPLVRSVSVKTFKFSTAFLYDFKGLN